MDDQERAKQEKQKSLSILDSITNKTPRLDINQAVGKQIYMDDQERAKEKSHQSKTKAKKSGKGGGKMKRGKAHFANKGGKGKFTGKKFEGKGGKGQWKGSKGKGKASGPGKR